MGRRTRILPQGFSWRESTGTSNGKAKGPAALALDFMDECIALLSPCGSTWQVRILADVGPCTIRTQTVSRRATGMALLCEWAHALCEAGGGVGDAVRADAAMPPPALSIQPLHPTTTFAGPCGQGVEDGWPCQDRRPAA